jgi:hypothetical protein
MHFTARHPVVEGTANGRRYAVRSAVVVEARTCRTRIDVLGAHSDEMFGETHRQHFHPDDQVRGALLDAGFGTAVVTDQYSHRPADQSSLRASWIVRRRSVPRD